MKTNPSLIKLAGFSLAAMTTASLAMADTWRYAHEEYEGDVQDVFAYMGMRVLWETEPIHRVYRDLQTASHHVFLRPPESSE